MTKSKLGISVGLFAALLYALGLFLGFDLVTIGVIAYVLIAEKDAWLRKHAAQVIALLVLFALANVAVGFIPDLLELVNRVANVFKESIDFSVVEKLEAVVLKLISIARYVVFIVFGVLAFLGKSFFILPMDKLVCEKED